MTEQVTIFKDIYSKDEPFYKTIEHCLNRIKNGTSKIPIELLREGQTHHKKTLPVVLWSGKFGERRDSAIVEHSGYVVLDFDNIDVSQSKALLATDSYVFSCWISPSGNGLKALIRISDSSAHRDHFRALEKYFDKEYSLEVDPSGINESRACYESYDENITINENATVYTSRITENAVETVQTVVRRHTDYTDYSKLNIAARMVNQAPEGARHETLLRAAKYCGGYISVSRMEEAEVKRVLYQEFSRVDYDSDYNPKTTIIDGINYGKAVPITETLSEEKSIERDLAIYDGDMSFISSDDDDYDWIEKLARGEIKIGLSTGNEELDEYFRFKKEFVMINGHSSVGKTTSALYLIVTSAVKHDWKWIIYSSENNTASVKAKLMQFMVDRKLHEMTEDERKKAFNLVKKNFTIISNRDVYSYTDLILYAQKIMVNQRVDGFFIDPYNSLKIKLSGSSNISTHEYHYEATSELLTFSKANDIAIWVNAHAVTEAQRMKGEDGLPIAPFAEQTEGGGKFVNRCDSFLTLHRKIQHPDHDERRTTEIHVRKVRETETGGMPTPFDGPFKMIMNSSMTGFFCTTGTKRLFTPYTFENFNNNLEISNNLPTLEESF